MFLPVNNTTPSPSGHSNSDPYAKQDPIVGKTKCLLRFHKNPHQYLSIDESLTFLPNKRNHKWSIKFWVIYDAGLAFFLS
jgi:hypothetical protein